MKLTPQHYEAINQLLQGVNGTDTAAKIGVSRETVSRWKADCDFMAAMNERLHDNHAATQTRLRYLSTLALETVEEVLSNPNAPAKDKLTASFKVLELVNAQPGEIQSADSDQLKREEEQLRKDQEYFDSFI